MEPHPLFTDLVDMVRQKWNNIQREGNGYDGNLELASDQTLVVD